MNFFAELRQAKVPVTLKEYLMLMEALDRQVIVSYLEDLDAASIGEITGLSPASVNMRVHRIKNILARWFQP